MENTYRLNMGIKGTWRGVCRVCKIAGTKILQAKTGREKSGCSGAESTEKDNTTGNAG